MVSVSNVVKAWKARKHKKSQAKKLHGFLLIFIPQNLPQKWCEFIMKAGRIVMNDRDLKEMIYGVQSENTPLANWFSRLVGYA
jgi:hypothetical protein